MTGVSGEPIDSRRLRAFSLLAREGSFAGAAAELHLSPSAMSHSIKTLETELECELFDRRGHRALLTPAGERLLPYAERILRDMAEARDELRTLEQWGHGTLRLGATASACQYFLPAVLLEFRECFPDCALSVVAADTPKNLPLLDEGRLDLAIGVVASLPDRKEYMPLFEDELVFIVSPLHPWAAKKKIAARDMAGQRLIVYDKSTVTSQMILGQLKQMEVDPAAILELGSMEAIKEMAKIGLGAGVVAPWVAEKELEAGTLVQVPFSGRPLTRQWAALWPRGRQPSLMAETFLGLCRTVTSGLRLHP